MSTLHENKISFTSPNITETLRCVLKTVKYNSVFRGKTHTQPVLEKPKSLNTRLSRIKTHYLHISVRILCLSQWIIRYSISCDWTIDLNGRHWLSCNVYVRRC